MQKAYKGSAVVIIDREYYKSLILTVLETIPTMKNSKRMNLRKSYKNSVLLLINTDRHLRQKKKNISNHLASKPVICMACLNYIKARSFGMRAKSPDHHM